MVMENKDEATCKWADCHVVNVRCEPVVEILSVSLYSHNNHDTEVYGAIYVQDGDDNKCFIYERDVEDCETVQSDGKLCLTGPDDIMSMIRPIICVSIFDKFTGTSIIDACAPLLKTTDDAQCHYQFEQFRQVTLPGTGTFALVEYLALSFGVYCRVSVQILMQHTVDCNCKGNEDKELDIFGMISAEYSLYHSRRKVVIDLFEISKDSSDSETVTLESNILLSRSVVVVPAYSSLNIRVNLSNHDNNDLLVFGSCIFDTSNCDPDRKIISGLSCFAAQVRVAWMEPYMIERSTASVSPWISSKFMRNIPDMTAHRVVEVFSIFIGRENDEQIDVHGMVKFDSYHGYINIFNREKNNPYMLRSGCKFLPLEGWSDALVPGDRFHISVDLQDVEEHVLIVGFEHSSYDMDEYTGPWYNRLLSCVIKGSHEHTFAVVHYAVFSDALKATLKVRFNFRSKKLSSSNCVIYGSIFAAYGKYGRKTSYERLFHRSVLFEKSQRNAIEVPCEDFDMELLKSVIAVPCRSSLHININLTCCSSTGFERSMKGVTMVIPVGKESAMLEGGDVGISIFVQWSEA